MNREEIISRLKELEEKIPPTLSWDWEGTNHYELTDSNPNSDYWWLMPLEIGSNHDRYLPDTEEGKRLGWIIEYAVLSRKLREMDK